MTTVRVLSPTVALALLVAVAGCGGNGGGPGTQASEPSKPTATTTTQPVKASTPDDATKPAATTPAKAAPPELTTDQTPSRVGRYAALDPLLQADGILHVAAGDDLVAVTVGTLDGSRLLVGRPTKTGPLELAAAKGAGVIPSWASIRVGQDEQGGAVVAYPSCTGERFATCVPKQWSARTKRAATVPGFGRAGGVLEVSVDRGNAAVIATTDQAAVLDDLTRGVDPRSSVWARRGEGVARDLKRSAADAISLNGDTLGTISQTPADAGVCGQQIAQLWRIDQPEARPRKIGEVICGLGGSQMVSLDLDATQTRVMVTANGEDGHPELLTYDGATSRTSRQTLGADVADVAWISPRVGITTSPLDSACTTGLYDTSVDEQPALGTCKLGRLTRKPAVPSR